MKPVLEGLLFLVGDEGINIEHISSMLEITKEEAENLLKELKNDYESEERGIN